MVKRLLSVGLAILMLGALSGGAAGASGQKPTRDNNCIHPSGVSLNELFDVPEQFVGPSARVSPRASTGGRSRLLRR